MPVRTLKFPADHSIGYLYVLDSFGEVYRHEYGINVGSAEGVVNVDLAPGSVLQLTVTKGEFEPLSRLAPDSLDSLVTTSYDLQVSDEKLHFIKHLTGLRELYLDSRNVGDKGIELLEKLSSLEILSLFGSAVSDRGLSLIARYFPRLRELCLRDCKISDQGLETISELKLVGLNLGGTKVTDAGLAHLSCMKTLRQLNLFQTNITGKGLSELSNIKGLRTLIISETPITGDSLVHLRSNAALEYLNFYKCEKLDDSGLEALAKLPAPVEITLVGCPVSKQAVARLKEALPNCRIWSDN